MRPTANMNSDNGKYFLSLPGIEPGIVQPIADYAITVPMHNKINK
jgi:hypothetical protein